jgi:pimeloyl-ACP methyl ester carboxylesterase
MPTQFLQTDSSKIAFEYTEGEGIPILFLHSALSTRNEFAKIRELFNKHPQILLDFPSQGESTTTRASLTYDDLAGDVLSILDHLNIAKVDIIGYSLGGYIGLQAAYKAPERVRSIVSHAMKFYWTEQAITENVAQVSLEAIKTRSAKGYEILSNLHLANGLDRTCTLMQSIMENFRIKKLEVEDIRESGIPVLLSVGDRDALVPLDEIEELYRSIGRAQASLAVHPNSPHPIGKLDLNSFEVAVKRFWQASV